MVRKKIYEMEKHQLAMELLIRYTRKICTTMIKLYLFDVPISIGTLVSLDMTTKKWSQNEHR